MLRHQTPFDSPLEDIGSYGDPYGAFRKYVTLGVVEGGCVLEESVIPICFYVLEEREQRNRSVTRRGGGVKNAEKRALRNLRTYHMDKNIAVSGRGLFSFFEGPFKCITLAILTPFSLLGTL